MFTINEVELADKGYYINLNSSTDRRDHVENLILNYNIKGLQRFDALTDEFRQFSCTKSHLSVFSDALHNNLDVIFVAEDDFNIKNTLYSPNTNDDVNFFETIQKIKNDLENIEWDIVLLGCNPKSHLIRITDNLSKIYSSTGAWAYLIKKRAYQYILENSNYKRDYIAIDDYLPMMNKLGFVTLTTTPMVMSHSVGFVSTLQPNGPVNYDTWIHGNYNKFFYSNFKNGIYLNDLLLRDTTIVITGHYCDNFLFYLKYLLHSLPNELLKCRFIVHYDETSNDNLYNRQKLSTFFKDEKSELNVTLSFSFGGLISSVKHILQNITTPYYIFLEHDWVFLKKDNINFDGLVMAFKNHDFINAVWFSKDDNVMRGFDIETDVDNVVTPFKKEERVTEIDLVTTCRWSNNPVMFRTNKMKEWYYNIIENEYVGITHQAQQNIEETMIPYYRKKISENKWEDIKDDWGTFLYGNLNEGPYVGHTDASKRYQGISKSGPEYNGEEYIKNNKI